MKTWSGLDEWHNEVWKGRHFERTADGLYFRQPWGTPKEKAQVRRLYSNGVRIAVIAREFGVAWATIKKWINEGKEASHGSVDGTSTGN